MKRTFIYEALVTRVVDGDTVDLTVDAGFRVDVRVRTRLKGINAPELSTPEGKAARKALADKLPPLTFVMVETFRDPGDKYGRWLATIRCDNEDINRWLVESGHAKEITT